MISLRTDIKKLKKEDKLRYKEVYQTLIDTLNEPNMIKRTDFNKNSKVKFKFPKKPTDKIEQYKIDNHEYYISSPVSLSLKKKNRHKKAGYKSYAAADELLNDADDPIDVPRVSSPPEGKDSDYFLKLRSKNAERLNKITEAEKKNKGYYEEINDFIEKDQKKSNNVINL